MSTFMTNFTGVSVFPAYARRMTGMLTAKFGRVLAKMIKWISRILPGMSDFKMKFLFFSGKIVSFY